MSNELKCTFKSGTMIGGKFEILSHQGEGSLGDDIYLGKQLSMKRDVLIRILPREACFDKEMVMRFVQSIEIAASLQHPGIIPAYEAGEHAGRAYLVTAAEDGEMLSEKLKREGRIPSKQLMQMAATLCDALDYAWNKAKILHRNIRPESILISGSGTPMLADFGMAKSLAEGARDLTMAGYTIGNPEYMSPEQVKGESDLDCRSDIYCLGLVLYEALAGKPAFSGKNQVKLMEAQLMQEPESLAKVIPDLDPDAIKVVELMLKKDKNARPQSWKELAALLKTAGKTKFMKKPEPTTPEQKTTQIVESQKLPTKTSKKDTILVVAGTLIFIIIFIVLAVFLL